MLFSYQWHFTALRVGDCGWSLSRIGLETDHQAKVRASVRQVACGHADSEQLAWQAAESVRKLMEAE